MPADDVALWLAAAGALIVMRKPSGLDAELEAAVMALELADWVSTVVAWCAAASARAPTRRRWSP